MTRAPSSKKAGKRKGKYIWLCAHGRSMGVMWESCAWQKRDSPCHNKPRIRVVRVPR